MLKRLLIALGWRGSACKECGFSHASHVDHDLQWHPDNRPCDHFTSPNGK
jgi:hypothetical protein